MARGGRIAILIAATAAVYLVMVAWSLPRLSQLADAAGLADPRMFDLRPEGFDFSTARALLAALGDEGRAFYRIVQQRLDTVFPPLYGMVLAIGLGHAGLRLGLRRPVVLAAAALLGAGVAGFDLVENALVARLLVAGPDGITEAGVAWASGFSRAKAAITAVTWTLLISLYLALAWRRYRSRRGG